MVEKKPKPVEAVMVDEESLLAISGFPDSVQESVSRVLRLIKHYKSVEHFAPCDQIPDDAPEKVKNEIANGNGRGFRVGILLEDDTHLCLSWYEPYTRDMVFFWDIQWPATVIIEDDK